MTPELIYLGLTQRNAPLAIREKIPTDRDSQLRLLSKLAEFADGAMVLATCERFEAYVSAPRLDRFAWTALLAGFFELPPDDLADYLQTISGTSAAQHLIEVAAGLDSRIIGERQILGQVRNAHETALERRSLDAQLSLLARTAIRAGKRVRHETALDTGCRSIVTMTMDWLSGLPEQIGGKMVAVVGSGRLGALVATEVAQRRPGQMVVTGRNQARAAALARQFDARFANMSCLKQIIAECDLVFTCTASPVYLVDASMIGRHRENLLRLVDLCVPRNVDPRVATVPCVSLSHLDEIIAHQLTAGRIVGPAPEAIAQAEVIVRAELEGFLKWRRERQAVPKIAALLSRTAASSCATAKRSLHEQVMRLKAGAAI